MFSFQTPFLHKNSQGLFKLETNGIRGASQLGDERGSRKRRKSGDDSSDDEDDVDDEDEEEPLADIPQPPPEVEGTEPPAWSLEDNQSDP